MKLSEIKLLQRVRLVREPPFNVAPVEPYGPTCIYGPSGFPYEDMGKTGYVVGITCEPEGEYNYPKIEIKIERYHYIRVPPDALNPVTDTPNMQAPIGITSKGDLVFALGVSKND